MHSPQPSHPPRSELTSTSSPSSPPGCETVQDKYGKDYQLGDDDEDDETDYSTDDDDAELVTPEVDAAILRTLAKIRAKDPSVYEDGRNVFDGASLLFYLSPTSCTR